MYFFKQFLNVLPIFFLKKYFFLIFYDFYILNEYPNFQLKF